MACEKKVEQNCLFDLGGFDSTFGPRPAFRFEIPGAHSKKVSLVPCGWLSEKTSLRVALTAVAWRVAHLPLN